jgi:amino acid transporter
VNTSNVRLFVFVFWLGGMWINRQSLFDLIFDGYWELKRGPLGDFIRLIEIVWPIILALLCYFIVVKLFFPFVNKWRLLLKIVLVLTVICLVGAMVIYVWAYWKSGFHPNFFKCAFTPYDPDNWTWRLSDCKFMNDIRLRN